MEKKSLLMKVMGISVSKHRLIGVVGGGGKTTLIYCLAREMQEQGYHVAVTTTTHMYAEGKFGFKPIGIPCQDGKIRGISIRFPMKLLETYDVVLVEADGSKHMPIKIPASHEPVLPDRSDLIIGVAGASAVGKTFREACHGYKLACSQFLCEPETIITERHILELLNRKFGQKKGVTCEYRYLVNQAELLKREQRCKLIRLQKEYENYGYMTSLKERMLEY